MYCYAETEDLAINHVFPPGNFGLRRWSLQEKREGISGFEQERQAGPLRESGREHGGASAGFAPTNDVGGKSRAIGSYLGMELLRER